CDVHEARDRAPRSAAIGTAAEADGLIATRPHPEVATQGSISSHYSVVRQTRVHERPGRAAVRGFVQALILKEEISRAIVGCFHLEVGVRIKLVPVIGCRGQSRTARKHATTINAAINSAAHA